MPDVMKSKLADTNHVPQIVDAQPAVTALVVTGTYATDDDVIKTWADSIQAVLVAHGLIKAS